MKVAVTIAGQMRDWKINVQNHMKHLIELNNADVFVYACNKNTLHTTGQSLEQKYVITTTEDKEKIIKDVKERYGNNLKAVFVNENEKLDESIFGTLGYFKRRMNNQMKNIRMGYLMATKYAENNGFQYDIIVRLRPDNSMFLRPVDLLSANIQKDNIYTTIYPSGHRDPWFFSFSEPSTFNKYCSFIYLDGYDESRTDGGFECAEIELEKYIHRSNMKLRYIPSICLPFYQYDKIRPITDFPFRNASEKLIDAKGTLVEQKV